jgi:hypothetical protein
MKFARFLQRGFLDTVLVLILTVQGGVRLGSHYLQVLSVCAMWSRVGRRVNSVWVARWLSDRCGNRLELLPLLGHLTGYIYGPGWAMVGLSWVAHRAATRATCK